MIPRKFHVNLPHKLQKMVTLFRPGGRLWHVETCHIGKDIYFQKGWFEFAKAHDLKIGYFMVFRYEGNMIFRVKIFDTTGCLKNYSPASYAWHASTYIEMESSSETGEQTPSKSSHEITSDIIKKRKSENDPIREIVKRANRSSSQKVLQEKRTTEANLDSASCSFERTLRRYCFSHPYLAVPKAFCMDNGLLTRRTIYLTRSPPGGKSWPVRFTIRGFRGNLCKGWKEFRNSTGLMEGDRCIFQLVSENSLLVTVIPQDSNSTRERGKAIVKSTSSVVALEKQIQHIKKYSSPVLERKGKAIEGSTSSVVAIEKQIQQKKQYSRPNLEWESTVRPYHFTRSYQQLGKTFCMDNNLTSPRDVTLRDLTGKEWHAKFYLNKSEGRLGHTGWSDFSRKHGLNVGDKCIFKVIQEDVLLIRVVKK